MAGKVGKFDTIKKDAYLAKLRCGGRRMASAREVGVDPRTVEKHMQKYPSFAEEVSRAEMEANQHVEHALFNAALSGNTTAIQVWLYNRSPDRWADKRQLEHSGPKGGAIPLAVMEMTDEQLLAIASGSGEGSTAPA